MILDSFKQQPADVLDYDIDFSDFLPTTDSISSATVTATGGALGLSYAITPKRIKVWCYGGVDGGKYKVTVTANTTEYRTKQVEFRLMVKDE